MKYKGFNIIEIEKKKGIVFQLDMMIDGRRVRRNFTSLAAAKEEASKQASASDSSVILPNADSSDPIVSENVDKILNDYDVSLDEIANFYKENTEIKKPDEDSPYLNTHIPEGKMSEKWNNHKFGVKLVNPSNKRKIQGHCCWYRACRRISCSNSSRIGLSSGKFYLF